MKSYYICILLVLSCIYSNADDASETKENKTDKDTICTSCDCNKDKKSLLCKQLNLFELFTKEDWVALNSSGLVPNIVDFSHNQLVNITIFPELEIKSLNLSHNKINFIQKTAFRLLQGLEVLDLSNNRLESGALKPEIFEGKYDPDMYEPLKNLKILRLDNNNLHSLDIDLFEHVPNLEELYLDTNPFKIIDRSTEIAISGITTLRILDLSYMELTEIPIDLFHTPRGLQEIDLTGNLLKTIPDALKFAINLKKLTLDENPISDIEGDHLFPHMTNLEFLSISYTSTLKTIGKGAFSGLTNLTHLEITNNINLYSISSFAISRDGAETKERKEWPPIKHIRLNHNNLTRLDSMLLARWDELVYADFTNNPWTCDCQNQWLISTLMPIIIAENRTKLAENVICKTPIEMQGIHFKELTEKKSILRCMDAYGNRPERDGAILIGLLVGLLVGIPITFAVVWLYKQGFLSIIGGRGPADFSRAYYQRTGNGEDFHI